MEGESEHAAYAENGFNIKVSDRVSLDRSLKVCYTKIDPDGLIPVFRIFVIQIVKRVNMRAHCQVLQ